MGSVDGAAEELRRIERDLHDGAQQRLVALAMDLGLAKERLARGDDPEKVLEALSVQLTNKLMHPPTQALSSGSGAAHDAQVELIARLYRLHPEQ